jgi:uncharacterized protein (DUF2342 family)
MATKVASGKIGNSSAAKSAVSIARKVGESVRRGISPVARRTGKQIGKALQASAEAAEKTAKIVAVRAKVSARELRVRNLFLNIGKSYYRSVKSTSGQKENAATLQSLVNQLDKLHREIASLKLQEKKIRSGR